MKMNVYTVDEIADFIDDGQVTMYDIYAFGYSALECRMLELELSKRKEDDDYWQEMVSKNDLESYESYIDRYGTSGRYYDSAVYTIVSVFLPKEDEELWDEAKMENTITGYSSYIWKIEQYEKYRYTGRFVGEANYYIRRLKEKFEVLLVELVNSMRRTPWLYDAPMIQKLLSGADYDERVSLSGKADIVSQFLSFGFAIDFDKLACRGVIPRSWSINKILREDPYEVPSAIHDFSDYPVKGYNSVLLAGIPGSGKTMLMAALFYEMFRNGTIAPDDTRKEYSEINQQRLNSLINAVYNNCSPVDELLPLSYFCVNFTDGTRRRKDSRSFVEIDAHAVGHAIREGLDGKNVWKKFGAERLLNDKKNREYNFLLFTIECEQDQDAVCIAQKDLVNLVHLLGQDGRGEYATESCTMSKIDEVAIIVTKCDRIIDETVDIDEYVNTYIQENYSDFVSILKKECENYEINSANGYAPYIMPFSVGKECICGMFEIYPQYPQMLSDFLRDFRMGSQPLSVRLKKLLGFY